MAQYGPQDRAERLARLKQMQEELAKVKTGSDQSVLRLQPGLTIVRILPPVGNMNPVQYHQAVGYHMIGDTVVRCSEFTTTYELKCPVCEVCEVLKRGGPKDKQLAGRIRLNKKYWMNVIQREKQDNFDTYIGPMILKAGVTIFNRTRSYVNDPDYGLIDDFEQGTDFKIEKTGEGRDTEYQVNARKGDYQPLIAGSDGKLNWDEVNKIMEGAFDLSYVLMPDTPDEDNPFLEQLGQDPRVKVYTYERTLNQYGIGLDTINQLDEIIQANIGSGQGDEDEDGNHAKPVRGGTAAQQSAPASKASDIRERIASLRGKS